MNNKNIAVKCSTQEQKLEVIKYARKGKNLYDVKRADECINLESGCNGSERWYIKDGYRIISYEEFERDYLNKTDSPIIGEYYTVSDAAYPSEEMMVGRVITVNEDSTNNGSYITYRGRADFITTLARENSLRIGSSWCYKDKIRTFRKSTPEEKLWLETCIKTNKFIPYEEVLKHKSMNFEVGKWYYIEQPDNLKYYLKFDEIKEGHIYSSNWLSIKERKGNIDRKINTFDGAWVPSMITLSIEIDISEIQPYLPEGHPDKMPVLLTSEEITQKSMKFKIGDIIRFTNNRKDHIPTYFSDHDGIPREIIKHGSCIFKENKGKIEDVYNEYYIVSYTDDRNNIVKLGFKEDVLELMPPEKPTLKVGMYLKALIDYPQGGAVKRLEYGKIIDVSGNSGHATFPSQSYYSFSFNEKDGKYELMPEGWAPERAEKIETKPTPKLINVIFDIGEEVMYKDHLVTILGFNLSGEQCVIDGVPDGHSGSTTTYWYDKQRNPIPYKSGTKRYYVDLSDLKKVVQEEIKAGDWVICIGESNKAPGKPQSWGWKKGLVFKVTNITHGGCGYVLWGGDRNNGVFNAPGHIRRALPCEIPVNEMEDWCVVRTPENTNTIISYFQRVHSETFRGNARFYGMKRKAVTADNVRWDRLITTEEFYKLAGVSEPSVPKVEDANLDYYAIVVKSGGGMSPDDIGKKVRVLKRKPEGSIANDFYPGGIYWEPAEGYVFDTLTYRKDTPYKYGCSSRDMVKKIEISNNLYVCAVDPYEQKEYVNGNEISKRYVDEGTQTFANINWKNPTPTIQISADVTTLKIPTSASVTLKNTEKEVKINVKNLQTIKIN